MLDWYFKQKMPGDTIREPVQGEFFATDAISDPGMALVREGIQNALDAGAKTSVVLVRIFVSGDEKAIPAPKARKYLDSAWPHYSADSSGIQSDSQPNTVAPCHFIAFEDFQTCGLEGEPEVAFRPAKQGSKNHFYYFYRAEGQSDKDASDRGSWGVGKHVFFRSSRINTIFGLTVRETDQKRLLMGKAVLKSHAIGSEQDCRYQDGYFGVRNSETDTLVLPTQDSVVIDEFASLFDLQRGNTPGLSIVIPWPDPEITDHALVTAVLRDYFYPILTGQLEVIVETPSVKTVLDANSLLAEVSKLDQQYAGDLKPLIELVEWSKTLREDDRILLKNPDDDLAWRWANSLMSDTQLEKLRAAYQNGDKLAVRVPVTVRPAKAASSQSFFDIYLVRDNSEGSGTPVFIREGITVSRVGAPRTRGVRAIVEIHDLPLAAFLRAAENPSHTEWQHVRLKDEYKFGYKTNLEFVKRSVHELVRIVTAAEREEDPKLLSDFFSIPLPPEEESDKIKTDIPKKKPGTEPPIVEPPPPTPQRFRIQKISGGFSILPSGDGTGHPSILDIRVAYDIRHGNALRRYNRADFEVEKAPIRLDPLPRNVEVLEQSGNRVVISIRDPDYAFHVIGFDERRQIYLKVVPRENADDRSAS